MKPYCFLICGLTVSLNLQVQSETCWAQDVSFVERKIGFKHHSPLSKLRHTHLTMGSGLAWIDFDKDGWPDLYCAQGREFPIDSKRSDSDQLFRNALSLGSGQVMARVSPVAGISNTEYAMGIAIGDYDNDGFDDIYVSCFGPNRLFHNNGDGTFETVVSPMVQDANFGASTTWIDLNNDGHLDLFVTNYLKLDPDDYQLCTTSIKNKKIPIVCNPRLVPAVQNVFYTNLGQAEKTFQNDSQKVGISDADVLQSLGVAVADLDGDGDCDLYVANDAVPNQLLTNEKGKLIDDSLLSGASLNRKGEREAGMGVAVGDLDMDGKLDLMVTNFYGETNTFYRNEGELLFLDVSDQIGLGAESRLRLGFGLSLLDINNDGAQDVFVANGHVHDRLSLYDRDEPFAQKASLFRSNAGKRFDDVARKMDGYFAANHVGRGSAVADFDRDGRSDLAVGHLNEEAVLLRNETDSGKSTAFELIGVESNRNAIGALLTVVTDERPLIRARTGSDSYLSADEGVITVGLGEHATVAVKVLWPGGKQQAWDGLTAGRRYALIQGRADAVDVSVK